MRILWIAAGALTAIILAVVLITSLCYRNAFFASNPRVGSSNTIVLPEGQIYEVHRAK